MNMDCVVIGTNLKNRFENLKKCTEFLDKYNFTIKNLTIDDFVENIEKDFSSFEKYGWNVFVHERKGIFGNLVEGSKNFISDWVFYCEDDVSVERIPTNEEIEKIQKLKSDGREIGAILLMFSGMEEGRNIDELNDYLKSEKSYKELSSETKIFLRQEKFKNDFFINFPVIIFKREVLQQLIEYIKNNKQGVQVEQAFSQAWFETEIYKKYFTVSYIKNFKKLELKNVEDASFLSAKDIEYFGSKLNNFLQNRVITKEINESHIFVKTLEKDWSMNSIQGGKSC
jgi:hypothetical protein